jgi:hypothetical protein
MQKLKEIDASVTKLQREIDKLQKERQAILDLPLDQILATELHTKNCRWNHTDQCSWYYFMKDGVPTFDNCATQIEYLKKAQAMISVVTSTTSMDETQAVDFLSKIINKM